MPLPLVSPSPSSRRLPPFFLPPIGSWLGGEAGPSQGVADGQWLCSEAQPWPRPAAPPLARSAAPALLPQEAETLRACGLRWLLGRFSLRRPLGPPWAALLPADSACSFSDVGACHVHASAPPCHPRPLLPPLLSWYQAPAHPASCSCIPDCRWLPNPNPQQPCEPQAQASSQVHSSPKSASRCPHSGPEFAYWSLAKASMLGSPPPSACHSSMLPPWPPQESQSLPAWLRGAARLFQALHSFTDSFIHPGFLSTYTGQAWAGTDDLKPRPSGHSIWRHCRVARAASPTSPALLPTALLHPRPQTLLWQHVPELLDTRAVRAGAGSDSSGDWCLAQSMCVVNDGWRQTEPLALGSKAMPSSPLCPAPLGLGERPAGSLPPMGILLSLPPSLPAPLVPLLPREMETPEYLLLCSLAHHTQLKEDSLSVVLEAGFSSYSVCSRHKTGAFVGGGETVDGGRNNDKGRF